MGVWSRVKRTLRGDRHAAEIEEELQFHLHMGMPLGNLTRIQEETRAAGIVEWLDSALQDARYGVRQIRRAPALTVAVVLSLAVGVGANTAIFSLVDAAMLRPLPVKDPGSLVVVEWTTQGFPPGIDNHNGGYTPIAGGRHQGTSIAAYLHRRLAREQTVLEPLMGMSADMDIVAVAAGASPAGQASVQYVSGNFFQGLGVQPTIGRPFRDEDDRPGQEPVVIVSHRFWKSQPNLDRGVRINNVFARVIGVAPSDFFGLKAGQWADIYAPLAARAAFQSVPEDDRNWWIRQIGRLKPGVSEAAARTELSGRFGNMIAPDGVKQLPGMITLPGHRGFDVLDARESRALWILMVLVGVLLLIVCVNVANLLLSRSASRQRESSMRLALGAGRARLLRQHLIESGVMALLGGTAGLALGYVFAQSIHILFQAGRDESNAFDLSLDLRVLAYTGMLAILTALIFGLAPALQAARADLSGALRTQTRPLMGGHLRLPRILVTIQIALCLAALVAAGLLGRSLEKLQKIDIGFDRENLAYVTVSPSRAGYQGDSSPYADRLRAELAALPGVLRVAPVQMRLLSGGSNSGVVSIPGRPPDAANRVNLNSVGDDFFETMRIPLLSGRGFEQRDLRANAEVVVVDEIFAKRHFPGENPLGRRLGLNTQATGRYEIVGVVGNSHYNNLRIDASPTVYELYRPGGTIHFAIRTTIDPARLAGAVRKAVAAVDPAVPLIEFHTQNALIHQLLRTERLLGFASGAFGLVALSLAAIGLGGLLAYAVSRRTNEIGVRMALGAAPGDVLRVVLRDSLWMVSAGVLIGLPCAYAVGAFLKTALLELEPLDPPTAVLSAIALLAVALLAAWVPARRAARIDPLTALREE